MKQELNLKKLIETDPELQVLFTELKKSTKGNPRPPFYTRPGHRHRANGDPSITRNLILMGDGHYGAKLPLCPPSLLHLDDRGTYKQPTGKKNNATRTKLKETNA